MSLSTSQPKFPVMIRYLNLGLRSADPGKLATVDTPRNFDPDASPDVSPSVKEAHDANKLLN